MKYKDLYSLVSYFFLNHLKIQKGLSPNTISTYKDALRLFLSFVAIQKKKKSSALTLDDFSSDLVLDFLASIEKSRKNSICTRNHRLAVLRVFFSFLLIHDPERAEVYSRISKIPLKRGPTTVIGYLEVKEISAILDGIDTSTKIGERDYILLLLLYNTGARVQELCDMRVGSFNFGKSPYVTVVGKGNKTRSTPIWEKTERALISYMNKQLPESPAEDYPLFFNFQKRPITRHGVTDILQRRAENVYAVMPSLKKKRISPHIIRHTTATHLIQSGVDLNVVKAWLGHSSTETTEKYVDIDMKMKVNRRCSPS